MTEELRALQILENHVSRCPEGDSKIKEAVKTIKKYINRTENQMRIFSTEKLDAIADQVQAQDPVIAMAIDHISDILDGWTAAETPDHVRHPELFHDPESHAKLQKQVEDNEGEIKKILNSIRPGLEVKSIEATNWKPGKSDHVQVKIRFKDNNEAIMGPTQLEKLIKLDAMAFVTILYLDLPTSKLKSAGFLTTEASLMDNVKETWDKVRKKIVDINPRRRIEKIIEALSEEIKPLIDRYKKNPTQLMELTKALQQATGGLIGMNSDGTLKALKMATEDLKDAQPS
jgi:hypothetical protein